MEGVAAAVIKLQAAAENSHDFRHGDVRPIKDKARPVGDQLFGIARRTRDRICETLQSYIQNARHAEAAVKTVYDDFDGSELRLMHSGARGGENRKRPLPSRLTGYDLRQGHTLFRRGAVGDKERCRP